LVEDPIAFAFGPDGKLWVVEMGDYPLGVDGKGKFGGKIKFLESTKGDGKYDKATVFLDGLGFPTGVLPWKKGVLITCAPDILYAEDTDGDGKADVKKVLFTGFGKGNQQHRRRAVAFILNNLGRIFDGDKAARSECEAVITDMQKAERTPGEIATSKTAWDKVLRQMKKSIGQPPRTDGQQPRKNDPSAERDKRRKDDRKRKKKKR
jgi:putative membrane-bound dehydrogenase-like protein